MPRRCAECESFVGDHEPVCPNCGTTNPRYQPIAARGHQSAAMSAPLENTWPPGPPLVDQGPHELGEIKGWTMGAITLATRLLQVAFVGWLVLGSLGVASDAVAWRIRPRLEELPLGYAIDVLERNNARVEQLGALFAIVLVTVPVLFLVWTGLMRRGLRQRGARFRYAGSWIVFGWVVPIMNLWRPRQMIHEMWVHAAPDTPVAATDPEANDVDRDTGTPRRRVTIVDWWWGAVLVTVAAVITNISDDVVFSIAATASAVVAGILAWWLVTLMYERVESLRPVRHRPPPRKSPAWRYALLPALVIVVTGTAYIGWRENPDPLLALLDSEPSRPASLSPTTGSPAASASATTVPPERTELVAAVAQAIGTSAGDSEMQTCFASVLIDAVGPESFEAARSSSSGITSLTVFGAYADLGDSEYQEVVRSSIACARRFLVDSALAAEMTPEQATCLGDELVANIPAGPHTDNIQQALLEGTQAATRSAVIACLPAAIADGIVEGLATSLAFPNPYVALGASMPGTRYAAIPNDEITLELIDRLAHDACEALRSGTPIEVVLADSVYDLAADAPAQQADAEFGAGLVFLSVSVLCNDQFDHLELLLNGQVPLADFALFLPSSALDRTTALCVLETLDGGPYVGVNVLAGFQAPTTGEDITNLSDEQLAFMVDFAASIAACGGEIDEPEVAAVLAGADTQTLEAVAAECAAGDFAACDVLWGITASTTDITFNAFAETCGERHEPLAFGEDCALRHGYDVDLDALTQSCNGGDFLDCDILYLFSPIGSEEEMIGETCGRRNEPVLPRCVVRYGYGSP